MYYLNYISLIFLSLWFSHVKSERFHEFRNWKYINFTWEDEKIYNQAREKGMYTPENIIIAGVKYWDGYYYLTLPRMKPGVPATLARIPEISTTGFSPNLEPFPSWQMNSVDDCDNLQNVQNIEIDTLGQIWIIDQGRINTLTGNIVKCQPKLVIFDIHNNRTTTVYNFPEDITMKNSSYLYDLVLDNSDGGYAYITDNANSDPGIIVYSAQKNRSWKIRKTKGMFADPEATEFSVGGKPISSPINVAGIALSPTVTSTNSTVVTDEKIVYFCPISSLHLFAINTTVLKNEDLAKNNTNYAQYIQDLGTKASQSVGMIMDNMGNLYYGLLTTNAISKWDMHTPFKSGQTLVAQDDKFLEWPNSFTFDNSGNLTVVINRLNKFIFDKLNLNEINFRLITARFGGKSYIYDDHNYEVMNEDLGKMVSSTESSAQQSSTTPTSTPTAAKASSSNTVFNTLLLIISVLFVVI